MTTCCCIADGARYALRGLVGRILFLDSEGYALVDWPFYGRSWHHRDELCLWDQLPVGMP